MIEGFLEELRPDYTNVPSTFTTENVNTPIKSNWGGSRLPLDIAIMRHFFSVVKLLLTLGANISPPALEYAYKNSNILRLLFEAGATVNKFHQSLLTCENYMVFFDYGGKLYPPHYIKEQNKDIYDYYLLVSSRVASSRKALAALIIFCKRGLFPLRDVGVAVAREMWVQRGPGGCGPRAYEWSKEKE